MYKIPGSASGGVRSFAAGAKQIVPVQELIDLGQQPGGPALFYNYLYVEDQEVIRAVLNIEPEPEYWLTEDKIPEWINSCSFDEFIDALNFAPEGTKDIIKTVAVNQKLNDFSKREAIKNQLGYDVTAVIEAAKSDESEQVAEAPIRRVATSGTTATTTRRTESKIIIPKKN